VLVSFVALSSVAGGAVSRQRLAAQKAPAVPATRTAPAPAETAAAPAPMRLVNAAFEGAYIPKPTGGGSVDPPKVTGVVADGRIDSSDWAGVRVRYAEEMGKGGPHSGKSCQRIDVDSVGFGSAQVEQAVHVVPGGTYRASLYVRASRPTKAELWLRNPAQPDKAFAMKVCNVGPTWQRLEMEGVIDTGIAVLMLAAKHAGVTRWVDNAAIEAGRPAGA